MSILRDVQKGTIMSVEDNRTIIRRYFEECVDQGNFAVYHTSFAPHLKYLWTYFEGPQFDYSPK